MILKRRIEEASGYRGTNFNDAESIGVICRGPSVYRIDMCCNKFSHCYLSGEFNNTLLGVEKYVMGKDMILCIMQVGRYRTSIENCEKFNIKNIQIKDQYGTPEHKKWIENFPDLKVVGFNKRHYEIVSMINEKSQGNGRSIFSTGISGVLAALYYNPKDIYIIGMDFYNRDVKPYFKKESMDSPLDGRIVKSIEGLRSGMIESIKSAAELFPETNFHIYTTYEGISTIGNIHVVYV